MTEPSFPVVGIGASAGGVEALSGFLRGVPPDSGVAYVVVTHLSPDRESRLHEILAGQTAMPVRVVTNGSGLEPDHVYVLPPDAVLGIERGRLSLLRGGIQRGAKPIDVFFSALAIDLGERAVGIVLSGGDSDGTLGVKAIKERGGLTFAQIADGYGPGQPSMPDSAIASGYVDYAIPVEAMGERLAAYAGHLAAGGRGEGDDGGEGEGAAGSIEDAKPEICAILRNQVGHDFSGYKTRTVIRRVQRRMQITQTAEFGRYIELLREEPREASALFRDLLVNVTNFFRDPDAFAKLAADILPTILDDRDANDPVRIWVPGCSTGEEVYSIAILVRERISELRLPPRVQIFATDIDEGALAVARAARYPAALMEGVSAERRERFFRHDSGSFVVAKEVRELCLFSPHSVIRDPPFSRIDLISCRNLLIYFGADVQGRVIPIFHYALRQDGHLFLGTAENVTQFEDLFVTIDKRNRIFRRRSGGGAMPLPLALTTLQAGQGGEPSARQSPLGNMALRQLADGVVLDRFAPAHVLVNRDGDVVYFSGRTGRFLEAPHGQPTRQLLTMARKGIRLDLRNMFRLAVDTGRTVRRDDVAIETTEGALSMVRLTVDPIVERDRAAPLYLVLFEDLGTAPDRPTQHDPVAVDRSIAMLERELRESRDRLQTIVEEYETALEELKSSNEELMLLNEELQSANEELEASKEELQSLNEELQTLNAELGIKLDELDQANGDLHNLFESTHLATVFLDSALTIQSFTPAVADIFSVLPADRGRPITDLNSRIPLDGFADDLAAVLSGGTSTERRVEAASRGASYLVRIGPYRDADRRIEGVVVSFVDITSLSRAEARFRVLIAELQHRTRNLLTVVQSIAGHTLPPGDAVDAFSDRLVALGRAQGLGNSAEEREVSVAEVIRLEVGAIGGADARITMSGPDLALAPDTVQIFALAIYELATNAVKYGALQAEHGRLAIAWRLADPGSDETVLVEWEETGVDMNRIDVDRRGYGRTLIERSLPFTIGAEVRMGFGPGGLSCRIEIPRRGRERERERAAGAAGIA